MNTTIRVIIIWTVITIGGFKGIDTMYSYCDAVTARNIWYHEFVDTEGDTEYITDWWSLSDDEFIPTFAEGQTFQRAVQIGRNVISRVVNMKAVK